MGSPVNLKCVYVTASDRTGRLVVEGRTRLFGISSAGDTAGRTITVNITLKNGSSGGDTKLVLATSHSSFNAANYQGNAPFVDMQSRGILFEDGIYFTADSGIYGASLFVEGGKDNAS